MEEARESLLKKLTEYGDSDFYPFHMPGHKRRELEDGSEGRRVGRFEGGFPNPYSIDITEIDGFDNLHHAEGILKDSMEQAAKIYGADRTYYLVNGSTCGILSAICGCTDSGGKILMARNCHKSAYHGVMINRLWADYLYPEFLEKYGINGGIRPEDVEEALRNSEGIQAVLVVSPTYEGIVSDIAAIAEIVHGYGIPLIVDEAHGAHFSFGCADGRFPGQASGDGIYPGQASGEGSFPRSALEAGADVVIQSLHKTLPSFTQTAVLHVKGKFADREKIERYLGMFQSSSPSYLFMAAIERCIRYMDSRGREEMRRYAERMETFYDGVKGLKVLEVLTDAVVSEPSVYDWDRSKIVISVKRAVNFNGEDLGRLLRERYHLEMEMCAPRYVIAMTSFMDTEEGLSRLLMALWEIDGMLWNNGEKVRSAGEAEGAGAAASAGYPGAADSGKLPRAVSALSMAKAMDMQGERIGFSESIGRISKEFIYLYPPGIPIAAPGERITEEIVSLVSRYKDMGLSVQGLSDLSLSSIITVAKEQEIVLK